jgi:hypothetical protein
MGTPIVATSITIETLDALIGRRITAIVIDNVLSEQECDAIAARVRPMTEISTYRWATDLTVLGTSVGEAHESPEAEARYFEQAPSTIELYKRTVFPNGSPIQMLVEQLSLAWPGGSYVPTKNGRTFLPEIVRRWRMGGGAHPHLDQSHTPLLSPLGIRGRIGLNVYIQMPSEGGAVEFWERSFTDEEYLRLKRKDYGLDRSLLGAPNLQLRPNKGQAVVFRAWDAHAVEPLRGEGDRITNAAFFGISDMAAPAAVFA